MKIIIVYSRMILKQAQIEVAAINYAKTKETHDAQKRYHHH